MQWQLNRQWRRARRQASVEGIDLMGDLPFIVGARLGGRVGQPRRSSASIAGWGRHPTTSRRPARTGALPVYDWEAMRQDDFSWMRRRAQRNGELFSVYRVDHAIGCYREYSRPAGAAATARSCRPASSGHPTRANRSSRASG